MNVLWIEDFGGELDSGKSILEKMFGGLLSFGSWPRNKIDLLEDPTDLERFTTANSPLHRIFLCRHYHDYVNFKSAHDIIKKIDAAIIDIRLERGVDFSLDIPREYQDKSKFHQNAGFYIFNDLAHLGFPVEKMCFMTGETGSLEDFNEQRGKIYIPKATAFDKKEPGYKLQDWIARQNSDYTILRRGVIEGSEWLSSYIDEDDSHVQVRDFIKIEENGHPAIEIPTTEVKNYLETLSQCLPVKQPSCKSSINTQYRLFLRTLVHGWEQNLEPSALKKRYGDNFDNIRDIYRFAWIVKTARNWVSHANLLDPLNPKISAFLFLVNMRTMFKLREIQPYEQILFSCISLSPKTEIMIDELRRCIEYAKNNVDGILYGLKIDETGHFGKKINSIYMKNTGNPDAEQHDYHVLLFQNFWVSLESEIKKLPKNSNAFLPTLARHIYNLSFDSK